MREKERRLQAKELDIVDSRSPRHRIPAVHWTSKLGSITYLQFNDGKSYGSEYYITVEELAHALTIIFVSAGGFGIGIGQLLSEIFNK